MLHNLEHRGACGCEKNTGDGAGVLLQMPHTFLAAACAEAKGRSRCPAAGQYGVGMVFLPRDPGSRAACEQLFEQVVRAEGQRVLGWRTVPTDNRMLGPTARAVAAGHPAGLHRPRPASIKDGRRLRAQALRHPPARAPRRPPARRSPRRRSFYVASLSSPDDRLQGHAQLPTSCAQFYPDLQDDRGRVGAGAGALALPHQHLPELGARAPLPL